MPEPLLQRWIEFVERRCQALQPPIPGDNIEVN
jgi:hypothetical protein